MKSNQSTPIMASDGEFILSPEQVAAVRNGDLEHGHRILREFVLKARREHIKTLKRLPPAKR